MAVEGEYGISVSCDDETRKLSISIGRDAINRWWVANGAGYRASRKRRVVQQAIDKDHTLELTPDKPRSPEVAVHEHHSPQACGDTTIAPPHVYDPLDAALSIKRTPGPSVGAPPVKSLAFCRGQHRKCPGRPGLGLRGPFGQCATESVMYEGQHRLTRSQCARSGQSGRAQPFHGKGKAAQLLDEYRPRAQAKHGPR